MIIKSISMSNFQCYYGNLRANKLDFVRGMNVIIGNNGCGKSKLFDAFYWVLNDRVFHSGMRKFISTKEYQENLISDKAKSQCEIGEFVDAEVLLEARASNGFEYNIRRKYKVKRVSDTNWFSENKSVLLIDEKRPNGRWELKPEAVHESILNKVMPQHVRDFMWFQGEAVDSLLDFTDKEKLKRAVDLLSNISIYDDLITVAEKGYAKSQKDLVNAQRKLAKNASRALELNQKIDSCTGLINRTKVDIRQAEDNLASARTKTEQLLDVIKEAVNEKEVNSKIKEESSNLEHLNASLERNYKSLHKKMFSKYWVLNGTEKYIQMFESKYKIYEKKHNKIISDANKVVVELPVNIPQPVQIENMLEKEKCFVCGRVAKEGSYEYKHIQKLLSRDSLESKKSLFSTDYLSSFNKMYTSSLSFKKMIEGIPNAIKSTNDEIESLKSNISRSKTDIEKLKSMKNASMQENNPEHIVNSFKIHESNKEKYMSELNSLKITLERAQKNRAEFLLELKRDVEGEVDTYLSNADSVFSFLEDVTGKVKQRVYDDLIDSLTKKSNVLFEDMTKYNKSFKGKLILTKTADEKYIPEIIDSDERIIQGSNDSNILLAKFSLMMAILMSRGRVSKNYTLITDAPTSKMADEYSHGFFKTLSESFNQSIVMTSYFLGKQQYSRINEYNLGNTFILQPTYLDDDPDNREELIVGIKKMEVSI